MKVYEKLRVGICYEYVTGPELAHAEMVHGRYAEFERDRGTQAPMSLAEFLLQDTEYRHLESFMWPKQTLVRTPDGNIGLTTGWAVVGCVGVGHYGVEVKTAKGRATFLADDLRKADVPPEVLEYVKSMLQEEARDALKSRVHDKVDEAFGIEETT